MAIDQLIKDLDKKFGKNTIFRGSEARAMEIQRLSTGSLALDCAMGGGIPMNRITLLWGKESAGKTAVALKAVASAQKLFRETAARINKPLKRCFWCDAEHVFDTTWAKLLGVDVGELIVIKPESAEDALNIADAVIRSGDCGLFVLDSIAALVPDAEINGEVGDAHVGVIAREMNAFLRKLTSGMKVKDVTVSPDDADIQVTVILINQEREKIGVMYGDPNTLTGGRGQRFYASIIARVYGADWHKAKWTENGVTIEREIGRGIRAAIEKNKTAPPKRSGEVIFYFQDSPVSKAGEFDLVEETVRYATQVGLIPRSGAYYYLDGKSFQGMDALVSHMRALSPDEIEKLRKTIMQTYLHLGAPKTEIAPEELPIDPEESKPDLQPVDLNTEG